VGREAKAANYLLIRKKLARGFLPATGRLKWTSRSWSIDDRAKTGTILRHQVLSQPNFEACIPRASGTPV